MKLQDLTLDNLRDLIREIVLEVLDTHPTLKTRRPREGWREQFAAAAQDTPDDPEWLDAPLTSWDETEWTW
ncbi:MAG: hypothetical protein AAF685_10320 [Cyanobacteria bacterium P01_C01_bin.89]